jgi:FtsZ-binding cell division protein ZapB
MSNNSSSSSSSSEDLSAYESLGRSSSSNVAAPNPMPFHPLYHVQQDAVHGLIAMTNFMAQSVSDSSSGSGSELDAVIEYVLLLQSEVRLLRNEVEVLATENRSLRSENRSLQHEVMTLRSENQSLRSENRSLQHEVMTLRSENQSLQSQVVHLQSTLVEVATLMEDIGNVNGRILVTSRSANASMGMIRSHPFCRLAAVTSACH